MFFFFIYVIIVETLTRRKIVLPHRIDESALSLSFDRWKNIFHFRSRFSPAMCQFIDKIFDNISHYNNCYKYACDRFNQFFNRKYALPFAEAIYSNGLDCRKCNAITGSIRTSFRYSNQSILLYRFRLERDAGFLYMFHWKQREPTAERDMHFARRCTGKATLCSVFSSPLFLLTCRCSRTALSGLG